MSGEPTLVACLTPPGRGAIATIAVRGPEAWPIVRSHFQSKQKLPAEPEPGSFHLGKLGAELADEVVLAVRQWTPIPWLEIHCHGGPEVTRMLIELLTEQGGTPVGWPEFERAAASRPFQALALEALAQAETTRVAAILLDQYHGAFEKAVQDILDLLDRNEGEAARARLAELARHANLGRHLATPFRVAVVGPPNVGKSSLINALAGYERSIVSATPGTTRDVVGTRIALEGWPIELRDTAGLRADAGELESRGMAFTQREMEEADLCLRVIDASLPLEALPEPGPREQRVLNKMDLPAAFDLDKLDAVRVSARTGQGVAELAAAIAGWLVPEPPASGEAVPFTTALADALDHAHAYCEAGAMDKVRAALLKLRSGEPGV